MSLATLVRLASVAAAMLIVAGCELHLNVSVNATGSGTFISTFEITPQDRQLGITAAAIRKQLEDNAAAKGHSVVLIVGKLGTGNDYVRSTTTFRDAQELSRREGGRYIFRNLDHNKTVSFSLSDHRLVEGFFPVTVQITMPGKIISSNADSREGRTARWSAAAVRQLATSADGLMVTSESSSLPGLSAVLGLMGAFLGIAAAVMYFRRRKSLPIEA